MSKSKGVCKAGGRSRRDGGKERVWREVLGEQRRSGESVRAFCRGRGLHETSFYYWRREIGLRDREAAGKQKQQKKASLPAPAPVVLVDELCDASVGGASSSIEIVLGGGTTVRVGPDSTREQLAVVLGVLEQARC